MGSKKSKRPPMPPEVKRCVKERSEGICEVQQSPDCTGEGKQLHHRQMRSQGGPDEVVNLIDVCPACHRYIHHRPTNSYLHGWLVRSHGTPEYAPILMPWILRDGFAITRAGYRWCQLDPDGNVIVIPDPYL